MTGSAAPSGADVLARVGCDRRARFHVQIVCLAAAALDRVWCFVARDKLSCKLQAARHQLVCMERGFHKPGDVENRLGFHVGQLGLEYLDQRNG